MQRAVVSGWMWDGLGLEEQEGGNSHTEAHGDPFLDGHRLGPEEGLGWELHRLQERHIRGRLAGGWAWLGAPVLGLLWSPPRLQRGPKNRPGVAWPGWS